MDLTQAFWFFGSILAGAALLAVVALGVARCRADEEFAFGAELGCILLALAGALAAMNPLLRTSATGSGDAYHYALQAADFTTQLRAGVFPVLVGQSFYGFNGNIHTLRTAPYYVHACGLVDLLTWHHLTAFALQNLVALLTALAATTSAYLAVRLLLPARRLAAALLALLYLTAPGVAGSLLGRDMYATFMAVPWLPWVLWSALQCLEREDARGPLALLTGTLALVWYAHPPLAILLSGAVGLALVLRFVRGPHRARWLVQIATAAVGFLLLTVFLFSSVQSMELGYIATNVERSGQEVSKSLPGLWPGLLQPLTDRGNDAADLQPGYSALALMLAACVGLRPGRGSPWFLVALFAGYAVLWLPWAPTRFFWEHLPDTVVTILQPWPHQRMMPIVAAVALLAGALGCRRLAGLAPRWQRLGVAALACGVCWNLSELGKFTMQKVSGPRIAAAIERPLPTHSITLTRSSYLLFRDFPSYFSHGYMEPSEEIRLLGSDLRPMLSNDDYLLAHAAPVSEWQGLAPATRFPLQPGLGYLLEFDFGQPAAEGEIVVASGAMRRAYTLPQFGESHAFGAGAGARHTLLISADSHDGRLLEVSTSAPMVRARVRAYRETALPLRATQLVPLRIAADVDRAGAVETPRVFIPGYRATVNGSPAEVRRSPEGLAMVAVAPGKSVVELDYPGPTGLRGAYFLSLLGLIVWPAATWLSYRDSSLRRTAVIGRIGSLTLLAGGAIVGAIWAGIAWRASQGEVLELVIDFPRQPKVEAEPLLVFGKTGAADVVYLHYDQPGQFSLGYDHWGKGGPRSASIPVAPGQRLTIQLALPSLIRHPSDTAAKPAPAPGRIAVDGRPVLVADLPWYPVAGKIAAIGLNAIGAGSCSGKFSGRIVSVRRLAPSAAPSGL